MMMMMMMMMMMGEGPRPCSLWRDGEGGTAAFGLPRRRWERGA